MGKETLPLADKTGIIRALPPELSDENVLRLKKFGFLMILYDLAQDRFVRPRLHKANPHKHHELLDSMLSPVTHSRVLDIACGTGGAIPHFDTSNEYTGLDLSYSMLRQAVKKAKKKSFRRSRFIQGNAEDLLLADESFDFVLMDTALHMIPKYQPAIAEISRVLIRGGVFVCSTPVVGISGEFDSTWKKISHKRNLHSFTEGDIKQVCSQNGLTYSRHDTNGGVLYFHAWKTD